jgi:hypothetical protein
MAPIAPAGQNLQLAVLPKRDQVGFASEHDKQSVAFEHPPHPTAIEGKKARINKAKASR